LVKPYIYVKDVKVVDENFHARFSVIKKKYIYKINLGEFNPQLDDYVYQSEFKLDVDKMIDVSKLYLGVHDFHNFVSGEREDSTCIVYDIRFNQVGDILNIEFEGKSFYRYMVRNLVGMMIEVGRGKDSISKVKEMLETSESMPGFTAPANGLYLEKIEY
jgi:tRNA pseudouridine38-40 synthase